MIGYILTPEQKDDIQGKEYTPYQVFNCVQDANETWFTFLTDEDKRSIIGTQYEWLLLCPQEEYVPSEQSPINL